MNAFTINTRLSGSPIRQLDKNSNLPNPKPKVATIKTNEIKKLPLICRKVRKSWDKQFQFQEEKIENGIEKEKGLRPPQIGAIHATIAHWKVTKSPATVVIPTGIGKTETMLSLVVSQQIERVLVIVPTDALREQLTNKFLSLGLLRGIGVVGKKVLLPVVGTLEHSIKNVDKTKEYFECCNVVITTMGVINSCSDEIQSAIAEKCSHLFIDEAHHTSAPSWKKFREHFQEKTILQFTATPFRNDGRVVEGKIIFNFPLKKAQELEYFRQIKYDPIFEYDDQRSIDSAIAAKAVAQLRKDRSEGLDHILMARVDSVERAQDVFQIYEQYKEFNPVQIHTGIKTNKEREEIRKKIVCKESRIVVCVDMLGEGFDLPELKIAAFHDVKKSLPITLQLVGRFTRSRSDLGDPTFIANAGNIEVTDELQNLYSYDADWNTLLSQSSEKVTQEQVDLWEFLEGFKNFPQEIPLQNIRPALSTVIYKTKCSAWKPNNWELGFKGRKLDRKSSDLNMHKNTLIIITASKKSVDWAQVKEIYDLNWELFILFWDKDQNLLFINSSSNQGYFTNLAKAVAGENVSLVTEIPVFRCFSGVSRLKLQNVGLIEQLGRLIRYTMRAGPDVESGLTPQQVRTVKKANIFGVGYENGGKTSIGCSYKGRIWARRVSNVEYLTRWCSNVGRKILDENIDPDKVLEGTLVPIFISKRPEKMPISIDWPEIMYLESETVYEIIVDGSRYPLFETEIRLKNPTEAGDLLFEIVSNQHNIELALRLTIIDGNESYKFEVIESKSVMIKHKNTQISIEDFFNQNTPVIWFYDGSSLEGNSYTELKFEYPPYSSQKIQAWDWTGIDIQKESQTYTQEQDSIQYKVIQELMKQNYDVIFDDDGSGEVGDVIAIKDDTTSIVLEIYHCKFSNSPFPGARIEDLYAVCGQAQKCVSWLEKLEDLLKHLQRRDAKRISHLGVSRFIKGSKELVSKFIMKTHRFPVKVKVFIVQPGLSKNQVSESQLHLLGVTENYLMDTYKLPFIVISSE